jgi:hypothetical protein
MTPRRVASLAALVALLLLTAPVAAQASAATPQVSVSVDRTDVVTSLGHEFAFRSTFTNRSTSTLGGLIAHLNVLSYDRGVYVDPEDWSSHRTRYLAAIPAGGSTTITWNVHAVNAGSFAVYVAVLSQRPSALPPMTGPAIHLAVAKRTTINSEGILPLALGVPTLLGLLLVGARVRRRG